MKDVSSIPAEAARRFDVPVEDGVTIAAYELKDCPSDAPVLLWGHANGFSAGSYLPLLQLLSTRFNVFAYDVRGQGASTTPPEPFTKTVAFDRFAHDMERVANTVQASASGRPLYFAGHSFSAATMYYLGGGFGFAPWRAVTTFDATLRPSDHQDVLDAHDAKQPSMADRARRRRQYFDSPEAYLDAMSRPHAFGFFTREMLAAHCQATLRPRRNGADGWELSCPPEIEAGTYDAVGRTTAPYDSLPNFPVPAHLVGADPAAPGGTWIGQLQEAFTGKLPNARYTKMTGCGHLMPFQEPDACAEIVLAMLD